MKCHSKLSGRVVAGAKEILVPASMRRNRTSKGHQCISEAVAADHFWDHASSPYDDHTSFYIDTLNHTLDNKRPRNYDIPSFPNDTSYSPYY